MNLRKLIITVCALVALGGAAANVARASGLQIPHKPWKQMTMQQKIKVLRKQIHKDRSVLRFWRNHGYLEAQSSSIAVQINKETHWAKTSLKIASKNLHHLLSVRANKLGGSDLSVWMCIHSYEGSWFDPGAPYWGGLQMDLTFQQQYGPEFMKRYGTADHWPIADQITAARRARDGWHNPYSGRTFYARGYSPWPKTSDLCGV